jgi:hypothetical protein
MVQAARTVGTRGLASTQFVVRYEGAETVVPNASVVRVARGLLPFLVGGRS